MRLFVGIPLVDPARSGVLALRERLIETISRQGVRFVNPEKLHLTLNFLGDVGEDHLAGLTEAIGTVCESQTSMALEVARLGCFPTMHRPKVIWAGIQGDLSALGESQAALGVAVKPFAPDAETKPYMPHLTIARVSPGSQAVGRIVEPISREVGVLGALAADTVALYESARDGSYIRLQEWRLGA